MKILEEAMALVLVVALVISAVLVLIGATAKYRDCQEAGGVLVRGMFGFECVALKEQSK